MANNEAYNVTDYCLSDTQLVEYYCIGDTIQEVVGVYCPSPSNATTNYTLTCQAGACMYNPYS